jgi:hypothetical protein
MRTLPAPHELRTAARRSSHRSALREGPTVSPQDYVQQKAADGLPGLRPVQRQPAPAARGDGGASGVAVGGTITTSLLGLVCLPGNRSHTFYGRIPASQNVPAGSYADSVVLTVTYR